MTEDTDETQLVPGQYGPYDPRPGAYSLDDPGGGPYNPKTRNRDWYNPPPSVLFGTWMRMRRTMIGMTQGELAEKVTEAGIKIDNSAIARVEKAKRRVDLDEAVIIARVLGVDLDYMLSTDYPDDIREWWMRLNADRMEKPDGQA